MRVTVCQFSNVTESYVDEFEQLVQHVSENCSDLVLLNEFSFSPWFPETQEVDESVWVDAIHRHDEWMLRLPELLPAMVLGSRPVTLAGKKYNEGYAWTGDKGYQAAHQKVYLPDDPGFWEATWYDRSDNTFECIPKDGVQIGFTICTEMWFMQHARDYGQSGAEIIVVPRATGFTDKWLAGGRAAAVISGAFHLSSNRFGVTEAGTPFGGTGWVIDPDGTVLAMTTDKNPFVTVDIDLQIARDAKSTYPRYVKTS